MTSWVRADQDPMGGSVDEDGKSLGMKKWKNQRHLKKLAASKKRCMRFWMRAWGLEGTFFPQEFDKDL